MTGQAGIFKRLRIPQPFAKAWEGIGVAVRYRVLVRRLVLRTLTSEALYRVYGQVVGR